MILCGSYRKNGTFVLHRKHCFLPVSSPAYLEVSTSHLCLLHSSPFPCIKSPILHLLILSLSLFICECKAAFIHGYHREKSSLCHTSSSHQQHIQSTARTHAHTDVCVYLWPHGYSQHGAGMSGRQLSSQTKELKMLQGLLSAVRARYM